MAFLAPWRLIISDWGRLTRQIRNPKSAIYNWPGGAGGQGGSVNCGMRNADCGMSRLGIAECGLGNEKRMPFSGLRPYSAIRNLQSEIGRGGGAGGRRQKAEGRRQEAEGRGQKAEGRRQRAEGRGQKAGETGTKARRCSPICLGFVPLSLGPLSTGKEAGPGYR